MDKDVTVIIPTLGTRPFELERAIESVTSQVSTRAVPLVVINGERFDADLLATLQERPDLRCVQIETAGVSNARLEGRHLVDTPYFAFLDDDDELMPDALSQRLAVFAETGTDVVATNGYRDIYGDRQVIFPNFDQHPRDPAQALLEENWLASAGGLYRTDSVASELLGGLPDFLEMTFLAFRLAHHCNIVRLNRPTFVVHAGACGQASESWAYIEARPRVLRKMQSVTSRRDLLVGLRRRRAAALHQASLEALRHRRLAKAWGYHLRSLSVGDGLRFLPYTRHILRIRSPDQKP